MSIEDKYNSVRSLLNEHNANIGEGNLGWVDVEKFISLMKAMGATTEDRLKGLGYEEWIDNLQPVGGIKPKLLIKEIAKIFRGKDLESSNANLDVRVVSAKKAEKMTIPELVANFDPENAFNPCAVILKNISRGEAFIVYDSGRTVDVESTIKLLMEVKSGYSGRHDYLVNGTIKKVYRIGELPDNLVDENPLYVNRPLRPDGTCDQTGRSWTGVPAEVRQLIRIAIVTTKEIEVTIDKAHELLDIALSVNAMNTLRTRYRKASIEFDELSKIGKLPLLKISLGGEKGKANPFNDGAKVVWAAPPTNTSNYYRARTMK